MHVREVVMVNGVVVVDKSHNLGLRVVTGSLRSGQSHSQDSGKNHSALHFNTVYSLFSTGKIRLVRHRSSTDALSVDTRHFYTSRKTGT